jgi:hypothetical protein
MIDINLFIVTFFILRISYGALYLNGSSEALTAKRTTFQYPGYITWIIENCECHAKLTTSTSDQNDDSRKLMTQ